jgi:predicted nucleic acid-binding protein
VISDSGDPIIVSNTTPIPNVKKILDHLIAHGARIGQQLYLDALNVAGE